MKALVWLIAVGLFSAQSLAANTAPTKPLAVAAEPLPPSIYLGNEGLLISGGDYRVLFDPFFHNGFGTYQLVPNVIREALFSGQAPYQDIDAIFISHAHGDHFNPDDLDRFLTAHPHVTLVAPKQAISQLDLPHTRSNQVISIDLAYRDAPAEFQLGELSFDAVRIPHAGWPQRSDVANIVYRVRLDEGLSVVHMGDADPDDAHFKPLIEHWQRHKVDTAFPPYWFFTNSAGQLILRDRINASSNIGVHVPLKVPFDLYQSGERYLTEPGKIINLP